MVKIKDIEQKRLLSLRKEEIEEDSSPFFSRFSNQEKKKRASLSPLLQEYSSYVSSCESEAKKKLDEIDCRLAYEELFLFHAREESRKSSPLHKRHSTSESRACLARIASLQKEREEFVSSSPDAYLVDKKETLKRDLENQAHHRLVDTPYVLAARKRIEDSLEAGIPVYLVGHLGSGKTQLAMEAGEDYCRKQKRFTSLSLSMEEWFSKHPKANEKEAFSRFQAIYPEVEKQVEEEDCRPYFISGSHNITADDMFSEKTLKLETNGGDDSSLQELSHLMDDYLAWIKDNKERLDDLERAEQIDLLMATWKTFSSLYIAKHSAYGTVVEKIDKEVLLALKEGKPMVLDEMNTIAMSNLIALNDILQHVSGEEVYVTGVGRVKIEPGFCFIGTGNLSTESVSYEGTNQLNPAFQSRFTTVIYNYLPQATVGRLTEQEHPEKNEFFRLMVEHLCDAEGNLTLKEGEAPLEELFRLAEFARLSEDIFEGHNVSLNQEGDVPTLHESVLSVRNLFHVLDDFNGGEEKTLSEALWNGFFASLTNADDQNLLLSLALRYGFFPPEEGWDVKLKGKGEPLQTYEEIRVKKGEVISSSMVNYCPEEVAILLFGEAPERKSLPASLEGKIDLTSSPILQKEEAQNISSSLQELKLGQAKLEELKNNEDDRSGDR